MVDSAAKIELDKELDEEIKEYHFHVYFFQENSESRKSAESLYKKINELVAADFFNVVTGKIHYGPVGPHVTGTFMVWVPKESLARIYSWFLLNRGPHSILIHPLTKKEIEDHSRRAVWIGAPLPVDLSALSPMLSDLPLQHPHLGLGYSARSKINEK